MAEADRLKWERKYADRTGRGDVNPLVRSFAPAADAGGARALDLACGLGANSLHLADLGYQVDAVDISATALGRIAHPLITTIEADLDVWRPAADAYDLIIDTWFLDRHLFPSMIAALKPGGMLIFHTFLVGADHIKTPGFKLRPGELRAAFGSSLREMHMREQDGVSSWVGRRD